MERARYGDSHNLGKRPTSSRREALACITSTWTRSHVVFSFAARQLRKQVTRVKECVLRLAAGNVFGQSEGDADGDDQPAVPFESFEPREMLSVFRVR
jgi:hypothetical protein